MLQNEDADLSACMPCPFCGGRELYAEDGTTYQWLVVQCAECDARCGDVSRREPDANASLVREWNTRANMAALWKRCSRKQNDRIRLETEYSESIEKASKEMEAEMEALKKDAQTLSTFHKTRIGHEDRTCNCQVCKAANRILEATKEGE